MSSSNKNSKYRIKLKYLELNIDDIDMSEMVLSLDYPTFDKDRHLYLYELRYFDFLYSKFIKMQEQNNNNMQYSIAYFLMLNKLEYDEISNYLISDTEFETTAWSDDYSRLNLAIGLLKNDPKFWAI